MQKAYNKLDSVVNLLTNDNIIHIKTCENCCIDTIFA